MSAQSWDECFDVIVLGSGAGGLSAAVTAAALGMKVLVLEKTERIGGSTAVSGGAIWAPMNAQTAKVGHPDSAERVRSYMRNVVGAAASPELQNAFLEAAPAMVAWFEQHSEVQLLARSYSPDYFPDREGAALGGRSLDPLMFDGRRLGPHFRHLRDPLPEFMVLGGMMITMTDAKHLLAAKRSFTACCASMPLVLRYFYDRWRGYHRGTRLVLGNALAARLFKSALDRGVTYWLHAATQTLHSVEGRVCGVTVLRRGQALNVQARRAVIVATGGFPWHASLRRLHFPQPTGAWSMVPQGNTGDGIDLAMGLGAALGAGHAAPAFWAPVSILKRADGSEVRYPHLVWDRAKPGLMAVNSAGQRFVNESTSYHEFVRAMYAAHAQVSSLPAYLLCDSPFMERWGLGLALPGGRQRDHLIQAGYLYQARTLADLAQQLGLDAATLAASVTRFNQWAKLGRDEEFGKGSNAYQQYLGDAKHQPNPCLGPLQQGPFYAVKVYAGDIGTALGLRCNAHAQVLDTHGQVIPGLYAAGNDMHSVMGGQYPAPGITLGPAMTFGWLAAQHIAASTS